MRGWAVGTQAPPSALVLVLAFAWAAGSTDAQAVQERGTEQDRLLLEADSLQALAEAGLANQDYTGAEPLFERALAIREQALGPDHPDVAESLHNLAVLYVKTGAYARAEPLFERSLAIYEQALGPDHPDVASSLNSLAGLYESMDEYARAEPLYERALAIQERALGPDHPNVAFSLNNLAYLYVSMGDYARAVPLFERSLAIWEQALGPDHSLVATALDNLAVLHARMGDYARSEPLYERALAIREHALGPDHPDVATSLNNLAGFHLRMGAYARAEPLYERSLAIQEQALGPDHPDVAISLSNLAYLYKSTGDYARAEPLFERALAIREQALGPDHSVVASSLDNLANLYVSTGAYARAEPLYERALAIRERALGPDHPDVALALNNLAALYESMGDYARAVPLFERSLAIWEQALGPDHSLVATALGNLAVLHVRMGDYARAEPLFERSLAIRERALGPDHREVALDLNNLAGLYQSTGDYARSEPLYKRSLAIFEKALGPDHPDVARALNNLASLHLARGEVTEAMQLSTRAAEARERQLAGTLSTLSEERQRLFLGMLAEETESILSLHQQFAPSDHTGTRLAVQTVLRRKGRALDATTSQVAVLRDHLDPEGRRLLDELRSARTHQATLSNRGPGEADPIVHQEQLSALGRDIERIEAVLASQSAEFRVATETVTVSAVQGAISPDAALVELVRYRPIDNPRAASESEQWGPPRYAVYVLRTSGEPSHADLGPAAHIDEAVAELRSVLASSGSDPSVSARELHRLVGAPILRLVGDATHLLLSPDGELNLVPFAALMDDDGRYWVDRYELTYLTSGRDLLRLQAERGSPNPPLLIAAPAYDWSAEPVRDIDADVDIVVTPAGRDWESLEGTLEEAEALTDMLPDAVVRTGLEATESFLKGVKAPSILHVATHAFFLDAPIDPVEEDDPIRSGLGLAGAEELEGGLGENPLLRSGLVLAGANRLEGGEGEDGILTALEASGLDLWGTELVVLSACETGLGGVSNGEGVFGLRRALVLAGAESQLMSLWKVADAPTKELMVRYYGNLISGMGRSEALRQVQLEMLRSSDQRHPYYWASFISIGDWRPLDGRRMD